MFLLLENHVSPWSERLRWTLDFKRIGYTRQEFRPGADDALLQDSGYSTVPVLWRDDEVLGDSDTALDWLETHHPEPSLMPRDRKERMQARAWEVAATRTIAPSARLVSIGNFLEIGFKHLGEESARKYNWSPAAEADASRILKSLLYDLAELLSSHEYLVGDCLTRADITMACMLMPVLGPPPEELFSLPIGQRAMFGIALGREPRIKPLRDWRDSMYQRYRGARVTPSAARSGE